MERQDSNHDQERQQKKQQQRQRYVYGRSFMARSFGRVMDRLRGIEMAVNTSTFGRVFRLDGSGHVCLLPDPDVVGDMNKFTDWLALTMSSLSKYKMPASTRKSAQD